MGWLATEGVAGVLDGVTVAAADGTGAGVGGTTFRPQPVRIKAKANEPTANSRRRAIQVPGKVAVRRAAGVFMLRMAGQQITVVAVELSVA
jgi:hypothetical protein